MTRAREEQNRVLQISDDNRVRTLTLNRPEVLNAYAEILASRPIPSLMAVKQTIVEPTRAEIAAASAREIEHFAVLLGAADNADALATFADMREAD